MNRRNWNEATMPRDAELTTIPIPSDDAVRDVASVARSLGIEDNRVSVNTHGLAPPSIALKTILFNVEPNDLHPEIVNGSIVFTVSEGLEIQGRDRDGVQWVRIRADKETHEPEKVEIRAAIE